MNAGEAYQVEGGCGGLLLRKEDEGERRKTESLSCVLCGPRTDWLDRSGAAGRSGLQKAAAAAAAAARQ